METTLVTMPITALLVSTITSVNYEQKYRNVLETHMDAIRKDPDTINTQINTHDAYKYEYDFYGLLQHLGFPDDFHWIVLRTNDMVDPRDYTADRTVIAIPSTAFLEKLRRLYMTKYSKL